MSNRNRGNWLPESMEDLNRGLDKMFLIWLIILSPLILGVAAIVILYILGAIGILLGINDPTYPEEERYEMNADPIWESTNTPLETKSGTEFEIIEYEQGQLSSKVEAMQVFVDTEVTEDKKFRSVASAIGDINETSDYSPNALVVEFFDGDEESTSAVLVDFRTKAAAEAFNPDFSPTGGVRGDGIYIFSGDQLEGYPSGERLFQVK